MGNSIKFESAPKAEGGCSSSVPPVALLCRCRISLQLGQLGVTVLLHSVVQLLEWQPYRGVCPNTYSSARLSGLKKQAFDTRTLPLT